MKHWSNNYLIKLALQTMAFFQQWLNNRLSCSREWLLYQSKLCKIEDGFKSKTWILSNSLYLYNLNNDANFHLLMFFELGYSVNIIQLKSRLLGKI